MVGVVGGREDLAGEGDVLPGVPRFGLQQDRGRRDAEADGVLTEMDCLATREHVGGGRAVAAGENQGGEEACAVQVDGMGGDTEVVAAQADCHVDGTQLVVHLVVVPDQRGLAPLVFGDGLLVLTHACSPWSPVAGPGWALAAHGLDALDTAQLMDESILRRHLCSLVEDDQSIILCRRIGEQDVAMSGIQSHALHR